MFTVSDEWKKAYPGAFAGVLAISNVTNPKNHPELDRKKRELEEDLRTLFKDKGELRSHQPIVAYKKYYKHFKKTYHVLQQVESIIFKGRSLPSVSALVEAMFVAELRNMLLTAGHDLETVQTPVNLDVATGEEKYVKMSGQEQATKAGDMMIADSQGILSTVIYGPDKRSMITPATRNALFTTYAPPGISEQSVQQHLEGIQANVRLFAPEAQTELLKVYSAD